MALANDLLEIDGRPKEVTSYANQNDLLKYQKEKQNRRHQETLQQSFMDYILSFHERAGQGDPAASSGLEAIHSLREIFGRDWQPDVRHPLRSRLAVSSEPSYQWLIHFVKN